jgi:hypothetical protein
MQRKPRCGCEKEFGDAYLNVGRQHFAVCFTHHTYRRVGFGYMSSWQYESRETHTENAYRLLTYFRPGRDAPMPNPHQLSSCAPGDEVWHNAIEEIGPLDAGEQAYRLGELAAWQYNKMADTGVTSGVEEGRIADARDRASIIGMFVGEYAREQFAAGFDGAIDFSLNADWRIAEATDISHEI